MAKDDYYVVVYKILAYLYTQLKAGEDVDANMLKPQGPLLNINERYHAYIISYLLDEGYIIGPEIKVWGGSKIIDIKECQITPRGIAYIFENSLLEKAKQFLKDVKDITPFI